MLSIPANDPIAVAVVNAIYNGNVSALTNLLENHPNLVDTRIRDGKSSRSLLHIATDWPGHLPNVAETIKILIEAGADVNARFIGSHTETPLHWAASSDDVTALDALLDNGADIEATGAVIAGGSPLNDAVGFRQWKAARRLVERGAQTELRHEAALGMMDRVKVKFDGRMLPEPDEINLAFWYACHGGQQQVAAYLLERGADINWLPSWENLTPLNAAEREGDTELVDWLRRKGGKSAEELHNRK